MGGTVPLSEHEQRQLEQIEQALYADHPRLARVMRAKDPRVHYRRRVFEASLGFVIGVAALVAGLLLKHAWLSAAGFVVMLLSSAWAIASYRRMAAMVVTDRKRGRSRRRRRRTARQPSSGLMERLEERWRRRQEGNNR
jgi:Protein of unknown function (DUF3040)